MLGRASIVFATYRDKVHSNAIDAVAMVDHRFAIVVVGLCKTRHGGCLCACSIPNPYLTLKISTTRLLGQRMLVESIESYLAVAGYIVCA